MEYGRRNSQGPTLGTPRLLHADGISTFGKTRDHIELLPQRPNSRDNGFFDGYLLAMLDILEI